MVTLVAVLFDYVPYSNLYFSFLSIRATDNQVYLLLASCNPFFDERKLSFLGLSSLNTTYTYKQCLHQHVAI